MADTKFFVTAKKTHIIIEKSKMSSNCIIGTLFFKCAQKNKIAVITTGNKTFPVICISAYSTTPRYVSSSIIEVYVVNQSSVFAYRKLFFEKGNIFFIDSFVPTTNSEST